MVARESDFKGNQLATTTGREVSRAYKGHALEDRIIRKPGNKLLVASCACGWNEVKIDLDEMIFFMARHFGRELKIKFNLDGSIEALNL